MEESKIKVSVVAPVYQLPHPLLARCLERHEYEAEEVDPHRGHGSFKHSRILGERIYRHSLDTFFRNIPESLEVIDEYREERAAGSESRFLRSPCGIEERGKGIHGECVHIGILCMQAELILCKQP